MSSRPSTKEFDEETKKIIAKQIKANSDETDKFIRNWKFQHSEQYDQASKSLSIRSVEARNELEQRQADLDSQFARKKKALDKKHEKILKDIYSKRIAERRQLYSDDASSVISRRERTGVSRNTTRVGGTTSRSIVRSRGILSSPRRTQNNAFFLSHRPSTTMNRELVVGRFKKKPSYYDFENSDLLDPTSLDHVLARTLTQLHCEEKPLGMEIDDEFESIGNQETFNQNVDNIDLDAILHQINSV